ncbi:MAG TPA: hypothetical protein V6D13_07020 [Halomicronema sp.]
MSETKISTEIFNGSDIQARTRLLLTLWDLGIQEVKKSELTEKLKRKYEKASQYKKVYEQLEQEGATITVLKNRRKIISLTDKGRQLLADSIYDQGFGFDGAQVGTRLANALLKWLRNLKAGISEI